MPRTQLTGTRIRERRTDLALRQVDLARSVGISASYLNLIEHNRRRIAGKLLNAIARELRVDPGLLADGAESALLEELRDAADGHDSAMQELARVDEFVGRFPGWAALLADTRRRTLALERTVAALTDRMTHDPFLSASMHEVLSTVTAIRSTASILTDTTDIDPEWRIRFHRNIRTESERLAESAESLVRYLDEGGRAEVSGSTPLEELDAYLQGCGFHISELEGALPRAPDVIVADAELLKTGASRALAQVHLERYAKDATRMPLTEFSAAAKAANHDPAMLARQFDVDLVAVFRRLASLPEAGVSGTFGLVVCDGSGTLTFRKPIEGFALPRFGAACPLWPLYQALSRPMSPVRVPVEMGGRMPRRFLTYAICQPRQPGGFDGPEILEAAMLIMPPELVEGTTAWGRGVDLAVGTSCRICPLGACAARREPSIMADAS
ncbi:MAG: transcriptional regulator with XRE-family HTH domain [Paracoccaceae bacterium]|jgi:transcriptional regulator with XRE-family HTH domain